MGVPFNLNNASYLQPLQVHIHVRYNNFLITFRMADLPLKNRPT